MDKRYDLVIVGGGSAGLVSALVAAGAGARVALIERDRTGGDCLWTGCVPSKSLIGAATLAQRMRSADRVGLVPVVPDIDFERVMDHVDGARARIAQADSSQRLRQAGVAVIEGDAHFDGPGRIRVGSRRLSYISALIATGSQPVLPPIPGLAEARPLTSETVWGLRALPGRLVVLGGGAVGCELGQAFGRLGSRVTIVEAGPRLLAREEPRASTLIASRLRDEQVVVRSQTAAVEVRREAGEVQVLLAGDPAECELGCDEVLVAVGRRPRSAGLGLESVGVATTPDGAVTVDDRLRTSARGVFAAGDVTGAPKFTHLGAHHARVATVNALFHARGRAQQAVVPRVTFTDPEVAGVGLTEAQARERFGGRVVVCEFDYRDLDRAITVGEDLGFARLIGDRRGRLVGATLVGAHAGESIAEMTAWMSTGAKIADVSRTVHAYPTMSEGPARAADEHLRRRYGHGAFAVASRLALVALRCARPVRPRR